MVQVCNFAQQQPFDGQFIWDYPREPVPEESSRNIPPLTLIVIINHPLLALTIFLIYAILPVQFVCLAIFCTISIQVLFGLLGL